MGLFDYFSSLKRKAQDATMDKVLDRMRDLKMPVPERRMNKEIAAHVATLPGIKSASVDVSREGFALKVSFADGRPSIRRMMKFIKLVWDPHKRSFVFEPDTPFDYMKDHATYACMVTALSVVMQVMLGFKEEKLKEEKFTTEVGPITGVIEKDGQLYYDLRRIPVLKQYANYRVMGQMPIEHLNLTDCWCEGGKMMVRIDNDRVVTQIKSQLESGALNLDTLRKMMKGDYGDLMDDEK